MQNSSSLQVCDQVCDQDSVMEFGLNEMRLKVVDTGCGDARNEQRNATQRNASGVDEP